MFSFFLQLLFFLILFSTQLFPIHSICIPSRGCGLALASFIVWQGSNLTVISQLFNTDISTIRSWNLGQLPDQYTVLRGNRINIPFNCDCINGDFLAHAFTYNTQGGDTYDTVATRTYSNLTNVDFLQRFNTFPLNNIPNPGVLNVTVNCSCGDRAVNGDYGLFISYPLRPGDTLNSVASANNLTTDVLTSFNPTATFNGSGLVFIPRRDLKGSFQPLTSGTGLSSGAIAGIVVAVVAAVLVCICLYVVCFRRRKVPLVSSGPGAFSDKTPDSATVGDGASPAVTGVTFDKPVEFSYEELASATDDFNISFKIGQGGFGAIYYAELRGEKAAIKKMDMQATREFLAEIKVLTHVHHLNLVRLIGYCVEGSLFLVYEYIENGNLSQHLHGTERAPLPWSVWAQIALDSARGLEYIHEHTVPVYVHRDIKSANILIDKNLHGKVADFGLTKLIEVGRSSLPTRLVGTFGYMAPEYTKYGRISPKVDVYAFGVVLYELISAKEAVVRVNSVTEWKGLVDLLKEVFSQPDPSDDLREVVDPRLGDNYPIDSVRKMAQLAKACTDNNPQLRPSMRSIVVELMTLSSSTED